MFRAPTRNCWGRLHLCILLVDLIIVPCCSGLTLKLSLYLTFTWPLCCFNNVTQFLDQLNLDDWHAPRELQAPQTGFGQYQSHFHLMSRNRLLSMKSWLIPAHGHWCDFNGLVCLFFSSSFSLCHHHGWRYRILKASHRGPVCPQVVEGPRPWLWDSS